MNEVLMEHQAPVLSDMQSYTAIAPGRVNLIGEHTDYTGGYVLPMAIPFTTSATVRPAEDGLYRFTSELFNSVRSMTLADRSERKLEWSDYPVAVLRQLQALGIDPPAFSLDIRGDVPLGAGLSSSASVEVATCVALLQFAGRTLPAEEIATLCRRAENEYVNSPCGIMDQFVITAAKTHHALLLHTRELTYELLPMDRGGLADCCIVITNSGVKHSIAGGDYGVRRREVEAGQSALQKTYDVQDLGEATLEQLESLAASLTEESYKRCRHIISENARVLEARAAMQDGDPERLGKTMTKSHDSQRDDFECSVEEIDFLQASALTLPGCYGARLTGGGFGGCTVNLVQAKDTPAFRVALARMYRERFGIEAETYVCTAVDGAVSRADAAQESAQ